MAFAGLIFIGLLFGILLSGIVVGFIVIRSGGPLKESLFGGGAGKLAFGAAAAPPVPPVESDNRARALLEDLRVAQKIIDKDRVEREQHQNDIAASRWEMSSLRDQIGERDQKIQDLDAELRETRQRADELLAEQSDRLEELSRLRLELRDARMELEVVESGSVMTSAQLTQLQRERDELAALVDQLQPRRAVGRPGV